MTDGRQAITPREALYPKKGWQPNKPDYLTLCMTFDLHHGDCLDILPTIPDASVDMILADLPYGTTNNKWDSVIDLDRLWDLYKRKRKPGAPVVLFTADEG